MEITIKDLGLAIKKSWYFILIFVIGIGAFGWWYASFTKKDVYSASAMVIVSSTSNNTTDETQMNLNDYTLSTRLVNTYSVLAKTDRVMQQVIDEMGLEMELEEFAEMISVSAEDDTEILRIAVDSDSEQFSIRAVNKLVDVFKVEVSEIMRLDNVQVIDYAKTASHSVVPNQKMYVAAGLVIGLVAGLVIALLRYINDDTIKDADEITEILEDSPVIGRVPRLTS